MAHTKKTYAEVQKRKALSLLKAFQEKIKNGELVVDDCGAWQGGPGKLNLKLSATIDEDSPLQFPFS
jgi:hypothetical protein